MARIKIARSALALLAVLGAGCAPEFDRISEIETLRVMAVQKSKPYARSGDTLDLTMLWRDGSDKAPRPVQIWWNKGCYNPFGDLFFSCFAPGTLTTEFLIPEKEQCGLPPEEPQPEGFGACDNKLTVTLPPDLGDRPASSDPTQPPYGLSYVFFAVCAGRIDFVQQTSERDFPIGCFDENNNRLGPDDFVAGYTSIYAYDQLGVDEQGNPVPLYTNANPPVLGFFVKDAPAATSCVSPGAPVDPAGPPVCLTAPDLWQHLYCDDEEDPTPPDPNDPDAPPDNIAVPCVPPCEDDGDDTCPAVKIRPKIVPDEAALPGYPEPDVLSNLTRDRDITEQMWINYYAERGGVKSEVRLLNDAFAGVNPDFGTEFYAPKDEGPTVVWAVIHDNRGGMSWVGTPILIKAKPPAE
jgi:hypothetical protein